VKRSTFVTVLAWTFIVLGAFSTLMSIVQGVLIFFLFPFEQAQAAAIAAYRQHGVPRIVLSLLEYVHWLFVLFVIVSVATLVAAIGLLIRREWGRVLFIALMVFGIAWNFVVVGTVWYLTSSFFDELPKPGAAVPHFEAMWAAMLGFNLFVVIGFTIFFGWIVKRLASQEIRREFS